MTNAPTVVGINRTQDGSIAVIQDGSRMYSLQKERISRRKHHWGRLGDVRDRYLPHLPLLREPVDLVVECYSSDTEIDNLDAYREELREALSGDPQLVLVSHHLVHLYSAFFPSPFERAAGLVIDAQGSRVSRQARPMTCWRSARSTAATETAGASSALPSSCGMATGPARPASAASTPCSRRCSGRAARATRAR
jgi:predicted NodU family carbamoyl transferase